MSEIRGTHSSKMLGPQKDVYKGSRNGASGFHIRRARIDSGSISTAEDAVGE